MANDKIKTNLGQLAVLADDDVAHIVAVALNADTEIRRVSGAKPLWTSEDIKRVAKMLIEHVEFPSLETDITRVATERLRTSVPSRTPAMMPRQPEEPRDA